MSARSKPVETAALTDEAVVERVLAGDSALYEVLVRRHNQKVYRAVRAVLRSDEDAEDVMQQAYLAAFVNLAGFRSDARFSTWLVRIAVNAALGLRRRRGRVPELVALEPTKDPEDSTMPRTDNPEAQTGARELGALLESLIEELPVHFRTVFVLREVEGMSTAEVAEVLELSADNVKTRLHRAKVALREGVTNRLGAAAVHAWRFEVPRCDRVARAVMAKVAAMVAAR